MRLLVTGATGFVGRSLVPALLARGHCVRAAARGPASFDHGAETVLHGDLAGAVDWPLLLSEVDAVVHLAAIAHTGGIDDAIYDRTNYRAAARLAEAAAAAGVRRFVFLSSIRAQSGPTAEHDLRESDAPRPTDAYGRSKLAAEKAIRAAGVPFTVLRPVVVYGRGVKGNVASLLRLCASSWPLPFGRLTAPRSLLAIENLIEAVVFAIEDPRALNETFIVADADALGLAEIVAIMRRAAGRAPRLVPVPPRLAQLALSALGRADLWERIGARLVAPPDKLLAAGWKPILTAREGLVRLGQSLRQ